MAALMIMFSPLILNNLDKKSIEKVICIFYIPFL